MFDFDPIGNVYLSVEEVLVDGSGEIWVDKTVRRFFADGDHPGVARVPVAE